MAYEYPGAGALDYFPCRHANARLVFRGPHRQPRGIWAAALGGAETYGRFVAHPWPDLLEQQSGRMVLNLGCPSAGPDAWLNEPDLLRLMSRANLRIVQVQGAGTLSNRFFSVHPRRNDRFLRASPRLRRLYPEVDFTEFTFTGHLLASLAALGGPRFVEVAEELGQVWVQRMADLLGVLKGPTTLLWLADRPPPSPAQRLGLAPGAPLLVDSAMLAAVQRKGGAGLVEVVLASRDGGIEGKHFAELEEPAALASPGPAAHLAIARALLPRMQDL
jgi:hypothetical protein